MPKINNKTSISIIVVSWNTKAITDKCLACMKKAVDYVKNNAAVEVVVVENASDDGTPAMIKKKHPWVKMIESGSDLGYAKGNNFGFRHSNPKSQYILLLNNDAFVRSDTLAKSLNFFQKNPNCDVLGCQLHYEDERFQPSAGYLPTPVSVWGWTWGLELLPLIGNIFKPVHPKDLSYFQSDRRSEWVMGASLFMKREVFIRTHGFDENFFMYMDEVEWCKRVNDFGYQVWYTPAFNIIHVDKASAFGLPEELAKIFYREMMGLKYYLKKYYPRTLWWLIPVMKMGIAMRWLVFYLLGNHMRLKAYSRILKEL